MNFGKQLKEGLLTRNPAAVSLLGLCTALAVTTSLFNAVGMGLCVLAVLILSNGIISALRPYLPERIRMVGAIVITATLSGIADLTVQAFFPELAWDLGLFLPLLAATCVLLNGAGAYACQNSVCASMLEGLCQGLGYTLVLILVGVIREFMGKGSFGAGFLNGGRGIQVLAPQFAAGGMVGPVGGFLVLACVVAAVQFWNGRPKRAKKKQGVADDE